MGGCVNYFAFEARVRVWTVLVVMFSKSGIRPPLFVANCHRSWASGLGLAAMCAWIGCAAVPEVLQVPPSMKSFSGEVAGAHLAALRELGPRSPGSRASVLAQRYLERAFRGAGAKVLSRNGRTSPLVARLPGRSLDRILVVTPFALTQGDEPVDDAGVAACLELARVLGQQVPPYTVLMVVGRVGQAGPIGVSNAPDSAAPAPSQLQHERGIALVESLAEQSLLEGVRAVIVLQPRVRRFPQFARDLSSQPVFRELFWETAARMGHESAFPPDAQWSDLADLHSAFVEAGLNQVLVLSDASWQGGDFAAQAVDATDPAAGFEALGRVTVESLTRLMRRLERIDAFVPARP